MNTLMQMWNVFDYYKLANDVMLVKNRQKDPRQILVGLVVNSYLKSYVCNQLNQNYRIG